MSFANLVQHRCKYLQTVFLSLLAWELPLYSVCPTETVCIMTSYAGQHMTSLLWLSTIMTGKSLSISFGTLFERAIAISFIKMPVCSIWRVWLGQREEVNWKKSLVVGPGRRRGVLRRNWKHCNSHVRNCQLELECACIVTSYDRARAPAPGPVAPGSVAQVGSEDSESDIINWIFDFFDNQSSERTYTYTIATSYIYAWFSTTGTIANCRYS